MCARHRLSKLLLRHGLVYTGGNAWTDAHNRWLRRQRFTNPATMAAFESDYETVLAVTARRERLDKAIIAMATDSSPWSETAASPCAVRRRLPPR